MFRAVIVEDEPLAARFLRALVEGTGKVEVVGIAPDGETGLLLCAEETPDAAFLDVRLPGPDGVALASRLALLPKPPLIVFTTAHDRACEAFGLDAVDYLLKPLDPARVVEAVCRLDQRLAARSVALDEGRSASGSPLGLRDDRLPVKNSRDDVIRLLPRGEILAAVRRGRRTWIHTSREEFATYYPLVGLWKWLGEPQFLMLSRNAIAAFHGVERVIHFGDRLYEVQLRDRMKTRIVASRSGAKRLAGLLKPPI